MKRVCELKAGDRFLWMGREFKVTMISDRIYYRPIYCGGYNESFGLNNQMKVEVK